MSGQWNAGECEVSLVPRMFYIYLPALGCIRGHVLKIEASGGPH